MWRGVGRGVNGETSEGQHWSRFSRVQNRDYSSVGTHYSMAVGNDEGLELDGTDDGERFEGGDEETKGRQRQGGINVVVVDKRIVWGLFRSNSEALYTNTGWSVRNFRGGIIYKGRCPIADLYCGLCNPCCALRAQCCAAFTADCA